MSAPDYIPPAASLSPRMDWKGQREKARPAPETQCLYILFNYIQIYCSMSAAPRPGKGHPAGGMTRPPLIHVCMEPAPQCGPNIRAPGLSCCDNLIGELWSTGIFSTNEVPEGRDTSGYIIHYRPR
ncbi:hypothetical protein GDO81_002988 [Engystomops pustulosus]|uniref:Uncharacterized protein n=1 Tax=Engystomops pustulosus TaxID=76066 RepID=A0AAV7DST9_ENGPU|nr:hypothetical protein GDO81_002988 [Engystomops pustulosus]